MLTLSVQSENSLNSNVTTVKLVFLEHQLKQDEIFKKLNVS